MLKKHKINTIDALMRCFLVCSLFCVVVSCSKPVTKIISNGRERQGNIIKQSIEEQLLLNIVRLRYTDDFLNISVRSITNSCSLGISSNLSLSGSWSTSESRSLSLAPANISSSYSINTNYSPLQGGEYVQQLMAPVSLDVLYQILNSGWSIARVFRIVTQSFNDLPNAPTAARPTTQHAPRFKEFVDSIHELRTVQKEEQPIIEYNLEKGTPLLLMQFSKDRKLQELDYPLIEKLGFDFKTNSLLITDKRAESATIKPIPSIIETRSPLGILYFFSKGVQIPEEHYQEGIVKETTYPNGLRFDWTEDVLRGIIKVHSSREYPQNADIAVCYRGYWFYIEKDDLNSKKSIALLFQFISYQSD